ncbi:MAG: multicopper oxidase domain-containing protein [Desulfobulbales bacterium]
MMKTIKILLAAMAVFLFSAGIAAAQQAQVLLPGKQIPKYVEPLPLLEFEFINATSGPLTGVLAGLPSTTAFPVNAEEFRAQILPAANNPLLPKWPPKGTTCGADSASSVWGYISNPALLTGVPRPTYLGPVVIAETGVAVNPTYGNNLPAAGVVQANLPIDQTLDWADPLGATGPVGCQPDPITGAYANPACGMPYTGPIPIATHLHGGEVAPAYDGGPDAWFTQGAAITGSGFPGATYNYPMNQQESTIWFHDHALGITRLNVYAGLAGLMPIIDPANPITAAMPDLGSGYDVPLIIQDRSFDTNCEIFYNLASNPQPNPTVHPFWIPEFIGDTIVVNGKTWPYLDVEPRQYRFRFVNGSNARFYVLTVNQSKRTPGGQDVISKTTLPIIAIATDDGYLNAAVATPDVTIGPGERYEIILDFSAVPLGTEFIMMNSARTPFPGGGKVVQNLTDQVMKFRVNKALSAVPPTNIAVGTDLRPAPIGPIVDIKAGLNPMTAASNPVDPTVNIVRQLTLNEVIGPGGPLELVINNSKLNLELNTPGCNTAVCRETEIPAVGDTEIWEIINITADAHPMHTHLTSFQVIDRQLFDAAAWIPAYDAELLALYPPPLDPGGKGPPRTYNVRNLDGAIGGNPEIGPFLLGAPVQPLPSEQGWKDTVITYPGEVTRIAVRWTPTDIALGDETLGANQYVGFDPTTLQGLNVGYVWHCHIVDHEDNEMMRNYTVGAGTLANPTGRQMIQ